MNGMEAGEKRWVAVVDVEYVKNVAGFSVPT
jgi:hypothetical protein